MGESQLKTNKIRVTNEQKNTEGIARRRKEKRNVTFLPSSEGLKVEINSLIELGKIVGMLLNSPLI